MKLTILKWLNQQQQQQQRKKNVVTRTVKLKLTQSINKSSVKWEIATKRKKGRAKNFSRCNERERKKTRRANNKSVGNGINKMSNEPKINIETTNAF